MKCYNFCKVSVVLFCAMILISTAILYGCNKDTKVQKVIYVANGCEFAPYEKQSCESRCSKYFGNINDELSAGWTIVSSHQKDLPQFGQCSCKGSEYVLEGLKSVVEKNKNDKVSNKNSTAKKDNSGTTRTITITGQTNSGTGVSSVIADDGLLTEYGIKIDSDIEKRIFDACSPFDNVKCSLTIVVDADNQIVKVIDAKKM